MELGSKTPTSPGHYSSRLTADKTTRWKEMFSGEWSRVFVLKQRVDDISFDKNAKWEAEECRATQSAAR